MKKNGAIFASFLMVASVAIAKTSASENKEKMQRAAAAERDNTAVNARDAKALTADEQAYGSERDVEITRLIRKELVAHKELSTYAQNVKIITLGGKVFLRGPVKSQAEKEQVAAHAGKVAGNQNVKDELEVVLK